VTWRACEVNWTFWGPLSGRRAVVTNRSDGLSTHWRGLHCPWRSVPQSPFCLCEHDFQSH
jgi:hypothetical protein